MITIFKKKDKEKDFWVLIENYLDTLYKIAYTYFKNQHDAMDAVQDTVILAKKSFKNLKEKEKFKPWVAKILINRCREISRRNKKLFISNDSFNLIKQTKNEYINVENKLDTLKYLSKLNNIYRDVIILKYFGDYKLNEIATILDIPLGTVKSRMAYGISKLKKMMNGGEI